VIALWLLSDEEVAALKARKKIAFMAKNFYRTLVSDERVRLGKMADMLEASGGAERPTVWMRLTSSCQTHVRCQKAQEKDSSDLGAVARSRAAKPDLIIGVGGCVASQEGARSSGARPTRCGIRPQSLHRPATVIACARKTGRRNNIPFPRSRVR